ncbi:MAG TPA: FHA domain-containing protein [Minicystis sp.]|nr:FHA domain-containing protein [Minicystis sp.]
MTLPSFARRAAAVIVGAAALLAASIAHATPEAHILRIDPRASSVDGAPVLTTVLEVVQNKRMSDQTRECAALPGDANLDCVAAALEKPGALYSSFDFPEKNAVFTVTVDGTDLPARFESKSRWGESTNQPGVGTAWLILVDAAASMGTRFDEAKAVATAFVNAMGPQDIVDVAFFNHKGVVEDSHWVAQKQQALTTINQVTRVYPAEGRTRPLFNIIKNAATDGFKDLGNAGQSVTVPMHQAMVVLSNGSAGADPTSNAAASNLLKDYLTKGRFPENNDVLPKTPVPVISIWFPTKLIEEFGANAREFMEGLANTEIGGFYNIVRDGQAHRAANIVNAVRTRFNKMHIVKWRVACVAPTVTQTFKLLFTNTNPPIAGDATFQNVPVGIDPTTWPLDIDREAMERAAKKEPVYPGGTVKIFGNFCWGGEASRAEIYMLPRNQAPPASVSPTNIDDARKAQRQLIEQGMRGKAISAGDSVVEFELPKADKFLSGKGDKMFARMILYDNKARRTSAITADKILTLRAQEAPPPFLLIGGITFAGVVIVLLLVSIFRGGGKRRAAAPLPRPVMAAPAPVGGPMPFAPPPPGAMGMGPPPPADFYAAGPPPPLAAANRAVITGPPGSFTVDAGREVKAGRDGAVCGILLTEPRVSGQHASLKVEGGQFLVRDENSNNGTFLNGQRLPPGVWTPVAPGAALRFGPVEFSVRLE